MDVDEKKNQNMPELEADKNILKQKNKMIRMLNIDVESFKIQLQQVKKTSKQYGCNILLLKQDIRRKNLKIQNHEFVMKKQEKVIVNHEKETKEYQKKIYKLEQEVIYQKNVVKKWKRKYNAKAEEYKDDLDQGHDLILNVTNKWTKEQKENKEKEKIIGNLRGKLINIRNKLNELNKIMDGN